MIKDIKELNFPAYATLETATATISDMGDRTITSQVKIDGDVVPDFSYDWEVEFKGERYIHPVKTPQGTKDNTSRKSKIDLVFQHWAIYEMKRQYFVEMASTTAGTAIADKYIASLGLNLGDFVVAFNLVLNHYFDGRIVIRLNPEWQYDAEAKFVSISYSYIWDVLQQMHEIYGVRWTLKTNADGVCEILMGYPAEEVSHIFEYGFEGGLLSVQRQVQSAEIRNRLLGRGGSKNLPARYFKDKDPNNPLFEADPDWIPELANIAFTELRGKTFRDYVRGWKAKRYGGTPMAEPTEAYLAGYNAEKFDPIEYVDDKESIEKYGVLVGALENNEGIYPSIQGVPGDVDMIVDAEQVTDDDVDAAVENDAVETNVDGMSFTKTGVKTGEEVSINVSARNAKVYFSVPEGKKGTINEPSYTAKGKYGDRGNVRSVPDGLITLYRDKCSFTVHKKSTGEQVSRLNIPPGEYYYEAKVVASHAYTGEINLTASVSAIHLITSTDTDSGWHQTFDIWVRNIWGSERNAGETDQQYADRVWLPILGDRMGDEARVVFASGWLSFSSDWEFPIVGYAFDDSKTGSHWRLTLAKIDAEKDAGRPFIPYEGYNASAGDRFFFIGIDMPWQYVYWGEERVDDYKRDRLPETARINPAWVIKADKVRLNQDREGAVLVDSLNAGAQIRLASKQFISGAYESLYVQSMTYNWTADTILYPDVEIVVSDKVVTVKNPVAQMQGNIETLQRQVGSLSNIQQIIRQVCDQLYLRKDGIEDLSKSPTRFLGKVTGEKFRQGQIGGKDWGIYRDENGNAIFEADKLVARQGILVSDLVVNEATYVGGLQIRSAAHMDVTSVEDTETGYVCYFDQKQGSVTNKFHEDDVVLCQKFDAEQSEVKFYKRRVVSVSETSVTLSKTDVNGTGVPAEGDVIIHYGNYTDKSRQFVIISDVIGGGYERMLMGLDSVTSEGFEYYFAGKSSDSQARWFVGDSKQYAKYENGQITIKGNLFVTGSDKPITDQIAELDYIKDAFGDGAQGLILGTAVIVGYNDADDKFIPMAGISGVFDKDSKNGGPAAWYGGTTETAKTMFFMDGTGYFASGNIRWDEEGGAEFGGGDLKIHKDGSVEFGRNIKITSDGDETLGTILTLLANISDWFTLEDGVLLTKYNLASEKEVSAKGINASQGGGSSYNRLDSWSAYDSSKAGYVLSALLGYDLHSRVTTLENAEVDLSDYYTKSQTNSQIASALSPYATKEALNTLEGKHNTLRSEFDALNNLLSSDTTDYINTWNEVVAFLDGYKDESDLATILSGMNADISSRLLASDFESWKTNTFTPLENLVANHTTKLDSIDASITNINTRLDGVDKTIEDHIAEFIAFRANFEISDDLILVRKNFASTEEVSAKGINQGTGGGGGSSYSRLDTWEGYDNNKAGYVLSAGLGYGLKVAIDELNGYNLNTRVQNIENSYVSKDAGGVVNGGLVVSSLAVSGGSSSQFLKADGSLDGTSYLPTSGGTITGTLIKRTTGQNYITFQDSDGNTYGYLGFNGTNTPMYIPKEANVIYTLLHSGNIGNYAITPSTIGSQSVAYATSAGNADTLDGVHNGELTSQYFSKGKLLTSANTINTLMSGVYCYINGDNPTGSIDNNVILLAFRDSQRTDVFQLASSANTKNLYYRCASNIGYSYEEWGDWKTIAFTDSNVASAQALKTASNVIGATPTEGGGILLGAERRISSTGTLEFEPSNGLVRIGATNRYLEVNSYANNGDGCSLSTRPQYWLGLGADGTNYQLRLTTSGNVLIGTTTDRGHRLTVGRPDSEGSLTSTTLNNSLLFVGMSDSTNSYGTNFWTDWSGNGFIQQGRTDEEQPQTYNLILQPFGGNVGIGTPSPAYKLDVIGDIRATESITIGGATLSWENGALKVNTSFYSEKEISAKGLSTGGGSGASYNRLDAWGDYDSSKTGYVLSAYLGDDLNTRLSSLSGVVDTHTSRLSSLENAGYITSSALSGYLPLSGGILTGDLTIQSSNLNIHSGNIIFNNSHYLVASGNELAFYNTQWNTLLHSGNVGSYAVISNQYGIDLSVVNLNIAGYGYAPNGWSAAGPAIAVGSTDGYTMLIQQEAESQTLYVSHKSAGGSPMAWRTIAFTDSDITGNAATATYASNAGTVGGYGIPTNDNKPWGALAYITPSGWMEIGKHIKFHFDNTTGSDYSTALSCAGNYGNLVYLPSASGTLALTTDNVASATKLQTPRTIWGQSFDGTGNVGGDLSDVTFLKIRDYDYGIYKGNYFGGLAASDIVFTAPNLYFYTSKISMLINSSGNIGIGTTDPQYKLHVDGTGYFSDALTANGGLTVNGILTVGGASIHPTANNPYFQLYQNNNYWYWQADNSYTYIGGTMSKALRIDQDGNTLIRGSLGVDALLTASSGLTVSKGISATDGIVADWITAANITANTSASIAALTVNSNATIGGTFSAGATTLSSLSVNGATTLSSLNAGASTLASLTVTNGATVGSLTSNGNVSGMNIYASSNLSADGTLTIGSTSSFGGIVTVGGASIHPTVDNPYFQLYNNNKYWYWQSENDYMYIGGTVSKAMRLDQDGNAMIVGTLSAGATTLSSLGVNGALTIGGTTTANTIKIKAGQSIQFEDNNGVVHTLKYDSTKQAFVFDGNVNATGEMSAKKLNA